MTTIDSLVRVLRRELIIECIVVWPSVRCESSVETFKDDIDLFNQLMLSLKFILHGLHLHEADVIPKDISKVMKKCVKWLACSPLHLELTTEESQLEPATCCGLVYVQRDVIIKDVELKAVAIVFKVMESDVEQDPKTRFQVVVNLVDLCVIRE